MVKHTQKIRRQFAYELFESIWPFYELSLKGLTFPRILLFQDTRSNDSRYSDARFMDKFCLSLHVNTMTREILIEKWKDFE